MRRKRQLFDGLVALAAGAAFFLCLFGSAALLNDNTKGWILVGAALLIAVPVVIFANREEKA